MASHHSYRLTHCRPPPASPWFIARLPYANPYGPLLQSAGEKRQPQQPEGLVNQGVQKEKRPLPLRDSGLLTTGGESGIRTPDLRIMIPSL